MEWQHKNATLIFSIDSIFNRRQGILWIQYATVKYIHLSLSETVGSESHDIPHRNFLCGLGLVDSVMMVVGAMVGSGIFIVPAEMARQIGSAGWLLVAWAVTGALSIGAALSYGELSAMMPQAGGMYTYLREAYSPFGASFTVGPCFP